MPRDFGDSPVHRWLGLELLERSPLSARCRMEPRPEFLQEEGVLQGGILTALADATAVYTLLPDLGPRRSVTSVEFKLNFLRPAVLDRGPLEARAEVLRKGRTLAVVKSTLHQAEKAVAEGLFTYLFFDKPAPGPTD